MRRKKKREDSNARKEVWRSVFEPYVPPSHGDLGYVSCHPSPETSDLTDHPTQTKTLDHRPPMSEAEFNTSVAPTVGYPATYRPQVDPRCQRGNSGGYTSEDDCQGFLRLVLRSIESRWEGTDRWVRLAETRTFLPGARSSLSSVFTGCSSRRTRNRTDASTPRYAFFNPVSLAIPLRLGLVPCVDDQVATQKGTKVVVCVQA